MSGLLEQLRKRKNEEVTPYRSLHVRPSLMFEFKEAAKIDLNAIYLLAVNGLEQLATQEPRVKAFQETLFAAGSKEINRELQTAEVNKRLDESIEAFLALLSPYFLLKATHKVLEYLIRRYTIQDFNLDAIMKCILPYHQTNTFVRMLQLLKIKGTIWAFFDSAQRSGAAPPRKIIVDRCASDRRVTQFICSLVKESVTNRTAYKQLFSFYTATLLELISSHNITENMVRDMWPFFIAGLGSSNDLYQVGSMMLVSGICFRAKFSSQVLASAVTTIAAKCLDHLHSKALSTILVVLQTAKDKADQALISDAGFESLMEWSDLNMILSDFIAKDFDLAPLMKVFLPRLTRACVDEDYAAMLLKLVEEVPLEKYAAQLTFEMLYAYNRHTGQIHTKENFVKALHLIDSKYPTQLDRGVEMSLQSLTSPDPAWKNLFKESRHHFMKVEEDSSDGTPGVTTLQLCLRQSTPALKIHALDSLLTLAKKTPSAGMSTLIEQTILELLSHDSAEVALHALGVDKVEDRVDSKALFNQLQMLIASSHHGEVVKAALNVLSRGSFQAKGADFIDLTAPIILSGLFHRDAGVREAALRIAKLFSHPLFAGLKDAKALRAPASFSSEDISSVITPLAKTVSSNWSALSATMETIASDSQAKLVAYLILSRALNLASKSRETQVAIAQLLASHLTSELHGAPVRTLSSIDLIKSDNTETTGIPPWSANQLASLFASQSSASSSTSGDNEVVQIYYQFLVWGMESILGSFKKQGAYTPAHTAVLETIFKTIVGFPNFALFQSHLQLLFGFIGTFTTQFLEGFWTSAESTSLEVVRTLNMLGAFLAASPQIDGQHVYTLLPSLMVPLMHASMHVRVAALHCIRALDQALTRHQYYLSNKELQSVIKNNNLRAFIGLIVGQANEIQASQGQLARVCEMAITEGESAVGLGVPDMVAIQTFLLTFGLRLPHRYAQHMVLLAIRNTPNATKLGVTRQLLTDMLDRVAAGAVLKLHECKIFELLIQQYQADAVPVLEKDNELFKAFLKTLSVSYDAHFGQKSKKEERYDFNVQLVALGCFQPSFFDAFSANKQKQLFEKLCELILTETHLIKDAVRQVVKTLPFRASVIHDELALCADKTKAVEDSAHSSKKQKRNEDGDKTKSTTAAAVDSDSRDWVGRLTVILEIFQYKVDAVVGGSQFVEPLFKLLNNIVQPDNPLANDPSSEYIEQLLLTTLNMITQAVANGNVIQRQKPSQASAVAGSDDKMDVDSENGSAPPTPVKSSQPAPIAIMLNKDELKTLEQFYDVSSIVQSIRVRNNPNLHNLALLLLSNIARVFPSRVLQNIMSVFSFLGASSQRFDDNYTFVVLQKTVERVIPALLSQSASQSDTDRVSTTSLLTVFVDRFDGIPAHRRLALFSQMLKLFKHKSYLPLVVVLLLKKMIQQGGNAPVESLVGDDEGVDAHDEDSSIAAFCRALCLKMPTTELVNGIAAILALFNDNRDIVRQTSLHSVDLSGVDRSKLMLAGLTLISSILESKVFLDQLVAQHVTHADEDKLQKLFLQAFQFLIVFYGRVTSQLKNIAVKKSRGDVEFWNNLGNVTYGAIESLNALLSVGSFVEVISSLLQNTDGTIQQKALLLFNDKLTQYEGRIADKHIVLFLQMTAELFHRIVEGDATGRHVSAVNKQTAALTVEIVARQFGAMDQYRDTFLQLSARVTEQIVAFNSRKKADIDSARVQSSMLVALATLCSQLEQHLLPLINVFFPAILNTLKSANGGSDAPLEDHQRLLQLSALSSMQVIVRTMSRFINTYLSDLLTTILQPSILEYSDQMESKVRGILAQVASGVRVRSLLVPLRDTYKHFAAQPHNVEPLKHLFNLAGLIASNLPRDDVQTQSKPFFGFFVAAFEFRTSPRNTEEVIAVEDAILDAFGKLVLKLNEALFRPIFMSIIDWAEVNNTALLQSEIAFNPTRCQFFYRLVNHLGGLLKNIFVPYYTFFVDNAVAILDNPRATSEGSQESLKDSDAHTLLCSVGSSLYKCFLYDSDEWLDKDKFNKIMPSLVNQLDTLDIGTDGQYHERIEQHVVPALAQLAVAVNHDSLWKPLNYQVLLKTRHHEPAIRYSALLVIDEFYHRLGEEFLVLLPESIQFFSELMEDGSPEVEQQMLKLVKRVEELLGEDGGLMNLLK